MPHRPLRWLPNLPWLTASLALMLAMVVPAAYLAMPTIYRWHMLNQLTASDAGARERALNYVIRHAGDDSAVRTGALERLRRIDHHKNRSHFIQFTNALDHAGVWSRRHVPDALWLDWISVLVAAPEPAARRAAAEQLAALTDLADEYDVWIHLLGLIINEDEPAVRHDALRTAALLTAHVNPERIDVAGFVSPLLRDRSATVARDAWIVFGLTQWTIGHQANWRAAPPELTEAVLWAALKLAPDRPQPALDALRDPDAPPAARAMAAYALHLSDADDAHRALFDLLAQRPIAHEPGASRLMLQRAILAVPSPDHSDANADDQPHEGEHLLDQLCGEIETLLADNATTATTAHPLLAACHFRAPPAIREQIDHRLERFHDHPARTLALVEGLAVGTPDIPVTLAHPAMIRLAATAKTRQPRIELIEDLFSHEQSTLRDLACIVARDRLDDNQLNELVWSLLTDLNPEARISGAILSGLTGLHSDLVRERVSEERAWRMQMMMRLGLWMQNEDSELTPRILGMMTRDDLPLSTILLAMLHRRDVRGFDFLLAPHGDPPPDLHRLLTHYRWWRVFEAHLPDDAPPLWLWADGDLQRFQIEVLRNWYRLNRSRLTTESKAP